MASPSERGDALVTGGSGYFGSTLVERLRADGCVVRVFDLQADPAMSRDVAFEQGDIRDADAVKRACRGARIVYHSVAQVPLARDRQLFESVNRDGTRVLLEAARHAGVAKVVHLSSSAVFGVPGRNPVTNETPRTPVEPYGRAKLEAEEICERFASDGFDVTIVRPRTILGPGRLGIFQLLFEWIRTGVRIPLPGGGDNLYQFVDAGDLADACVRAGAKTGPAIFNIGAERFGTMRETIEAVCRHAGTGSRVVSLPAAPAVWAMQASAALRLSPLAPYHWIMLGRTFYFDVAPAASALGWRASASNADAMVAAYDWYVANREAVLRSTGPAHRAPVREGILRLARWLLR